MAGAGLSVATISLRVALEVTTSANVLSPPLVFASRVSVGGRLRAHRGGALSGRVTKAATVEAGTGAGLQTSSDHRGGLTISPSVVSIRLIQLEGHLQNFREGPVLGSGMIAKDLTDAIRTKTIDKL